MAGALGMESSGVQLQGAELKGLCKQRSIMKEETNYKQKIREITLDFTGVKTLWELHERIRIAFK